MEAYLEDNRPIMDKICASRDECNEECPCYEICFSQAEKEDKE